MSWDLDTALDFQSFPEFFSNINTVLDGYLGLGLLVIVFLITFTVSKAKFAPNSTAFAVSSYLCALIAVPMRVLGWVSDYVVWVVIVMAAVAVFIQIIAERN